MKYAIIDIETTGGNPKTEKITEIAIFIHDGNRVIATYESLINPEKIIPPFITQLTGITNEMVSEAPKFFEIAKTIVQLTDQAVFVAHNVNFDYSFVRNEFKALGYDFKRKTLDTVRLSRRLIPGHASYSLGKLCSDLDIKITGRHRASGDAWATVKLFEILLNKKEDFERLANPEKYKYLKGIDTALHKSILSKAPEKTGVYYFYNQEQKLIYIGKSTNIKKRVAQHLRSSTNKKAMDMRAQIVDVHFEITGSELVALLLESAEIKKHKPLFNRAQRRTLFNVGLYSNYDVQGYVNFKLEKVAKKHGVPVATFSNMVEAKNYLYHNVERFLLCQKLCGLYKTDAACFHYGVGMCKGACVGKESHTEYNKRAFEFLKTMDYTIQDFLLIDAGSEAHNKSVILVKNGKYQGFGFFDPEFVKNSDDLQAAVKPQQDNRDVQQIIKSFMRHYKYEKLIYLE